jgi:serine/threonine protein kinase
MWTPTGTLAYKAPEMLDGVSYTEAVDMWALGVTLFQMVTGREPFYEEYLIDTIEKIRNIDYEFGEEWGNYSKFAKDLVSRLLK